MITITEGVGFVTVQIPVHIRPKGSGAAMLARGTKRPIIVWDPPDYKKVAVAVRKALIEAWGERPALNGPVRYSAVYTFHRPKSNKTPYPVTQGDLSKLMRRVEDWLAGNRTEPGPVLANDNLIVETGLHRKLWGEEEGVTVTLMLLEAM